MIFHGSVDCTNKKKIAGFILSLLNKFIDEIGDENIVHVVTDSESANKAAGQKLMIERPHLFWSPCAAHCIDLMLEDIGKMSKEYNNTSKGRKCAEKIAAIILDTRFWKTARDICAAMEPLVKVLKLVDQDNTPTLSIIYEEMDRAKLSMKESEEVEDITGYLNTLKSKWSKYGCTIMCDGWSTRNKHHIINFMIYYDCNMIFHGSVDCTNKKKIAGFILSLLNKFIDEIGDENIVHMVTDSESANKAAGQKLMIERPHLFWSPCAAHCIDLMLEDMGTYVYTDEVKRGLNAVVKRLEPDLNSQASTISEIKLFTEQMGEFGSPLAKTSVKKSLPAEWWNDYGE
ncbi:uncharacterized protein [Primulina eburnea]|uniref:uncharacterized protein n=1 Tax=Primulina eburnea TaxID=1245227 RepID=UPI003C6C645F